MEEEVDEGEGLGESSYARWWVWATSAQKIF